MSDFDADPTTDPLVRALQAPGTAAELADQQAYREMFRQEHPSVVRPVVGVAPASIGLAARSRNAVRRLGVGSAVAVALAVGGSGVAAAYAGALPDPIQRITHRVLAPVGVPSAPDPKPERREQAKAAPSKSATPTATSGAEPTVTRSARPRPSASSAPTRQPGRPGQRGSVQPDPSSRPSAAATSDAPGAVASTGPDAEASTSATDAPSAGPSEVPTGVPSAVPSAVPGETLPPSPGASSLPVIGLRPRTITTTADADRVQAGARVVLTAAVDAGDGSPVARATVVLERRTDSRWREVSTRTTDDEGIVSITSSPVMRTTDFRMTASDVVGPVVRVVPAPALSIDRTLLDRRTLSVTVTAYGAQRGDLVRLVRQRDNGSVDVDQARVNRFGEARFDIGLRGQAKTYRAVVSRTARHAASAIEVDVPARGGS